MKKKKKKEVFLWPKSEPFIHSQSKGRFSVKYEKGSIMGIDKMVVTIH